MDEMKDFKRVLALARNLVQRFTGCSKPFLTSDIEKIDSWASHSGRKWVTTRLKDLKAIAFSFLANGQADLSEYMGKKTTYKGKEIPALRCFSLLIDAIENGNHKAIRSILDLLNSYQVFRGPGDDVEEKINVITSKPEVVIDDASKASLIADIYKYLPFPKCSKPYRMDFKGPDIGGARYACKPRMNSDCLSALISTLSSIPEWIWESAPGLKDWVNNQAYFQGVIKPYGETLMSDGRKVPSVFWGGNLAILGESGLKTRIVFVGNPWVQGLLKPAMVPLQRRIISLQTDCTFDQEQGISFLEKLSKEGKSPIYSVDLSSATDNFPFFLQRAVGKVCGIPEYQLDILEYSGFYNPLSKSDYKVYGYGKGQPMGLYPSFVLFALTHNCLLTAMARKLGIDPSQSFRVLGDDVILTNERLYLEYSSTLSRLGVPISKKKSYSSLVFGEFAGKVFWRGHNVTPIKWRHVTAASLEVVSQYLERRLVEIDETDQKVKSIPLSDPSVYPHVEALLPLPKSVGGFDKLTRLPLAERLTWGRRRVQSLRAGYLNMVTERITAFLTGERLLKNIDITKFPGLENQGLKVTDLVRKASKIGQAMPGPYGTPEKEDLPKSREGLKSLESIVFSTDSIEEQLGKYHAWFIAMLGPNPVREFNRMITCSGEPIDILALPIVNSGTEAKRLRRLRHLPPKQLDELFQSAEEKSKVLRQLRNHLKNPEPLPVATGVPIGRIAATVGATIVNPVLGAVMGIGSLLTAIADGDDGYKPLGNEKIVP